GNLFDTMLATGKPYASGDSAGDVYNKDELVARGFAPIGCDGVVDGNDITYVFNNFGDWSDQFQAIFMDLSCDMNGDLVVDLDDVSKVVRDILGTNFGDVNLDGVIDAADASIAMMNLGMPGDWKTGDVNGDGQVTQRDLDIINNGGLDLGCPTDFNNDGTTNAADLGILLGSWNGAGIADLNGDGTINAADLGILLGSWGDCE
ncbi:MAG: dockerin type I domain-containing protein, partial [Planctomycetota bacterium]|nr:dockerin type I domain-containing protein [Planctomycetota bacterium]